MNFLWYFVGTSISALRHSATLRNKVTRKSENTSTMINWHYSLLHLSWTFFVILDTKGFRMDNLQKATREKYYRLCRLHRTSMNDLWTFPSISSKQAEARCSECNRKRWRGNGGQGFSRFSIIFSQRSQKNYQKFMKGTCHCHKQGSRAPSIIKYSIGECFKDNCMKFNR